MLYLMVTFYATRFSYTKKEKLMKLLLFSLFMTGLTILFFLILSFIVNLIL